MRRSAAIVLALLLPGLATSEEPAVHVAGDERPPVLDVMDEADASLFAVAISSNGKRAVMAVDATAKGPRSELRLFEAGRGAVGTDFVKGRIRDLIFSRDGATLYGLQHFAAKKREGDTFLLTLDWATAKAVKGMRLPASAGGLDHWMARDALLVAARNEIRTILLPGLTSGPLFRVLGENTSVASLGGDVVLVGQDDGLALVDLGLPSGREAMPFADRTATRAAVVSLAAEPDGMGALARLADGSIVPVELSPLSLGTARASTGDVAARARSGPEQDPEPPEIARPEVVAPEAPPPPDEEAAEPEPIEVKTPAPPPPPVEEIAEPEPAKAATTESPPATAEDVVEPEFEPENVEKATPPPPVVEEVVEPEPSGPLPQIQGLIVGPAAGRVESVALFGPDNILREAARVRPAQNRWKADGLAPGRYRVELSGGGGSVLVTEPRFLMITVAPGEPATAPVFKVLSAL